MYIDECLKDKITYANLHQYINSENKILLSTENAFIVLLPKKNIYVADCKDSECENLFKELNKYDIKVITIFSDKLFELLKPNYKGYNVSYQALYDGEIGEKNKNLIYLKKEDLEYVKNTYNDGNNKSGVEEAFKSNNLLGYYENGELIGYIGRHMDGSIGYLHVKEKFRRKGYGSLILKSVYSFWDNQVPFTHVIIGNIPSENLHKKLGCKFGEKKIYWLWNI